MFDKKIFERNDYKIGISLGIILILISAGSQIETPLFEISQNFDWLLVLLIGLFVFFFFMGIALNTDTATKINENNKHTFEESVTYLKNFNILSKFCFWVSGGMFLLFVIRLSFIIWK